MAPGPDIAVLDANVLFPFRMRDALLRFCEAGLFRACWTDRILDEWQAAVLRRYPGAGASLEQQRAALLDAFPEAWVSVDEELIAQLDLPDPDDRHVLAVGITGGAGLIVTGNLKDFPAASLAPFGLRALDADAFLTGLFEQDPDQAVSALRRMRLAYRHPAMTPETFLGELAHAGLPGLSRAARDRLSDI
ncbi:MAG: PIN domain-containing protein [Oceanicaulis sp.]|nr:PIN domain-containing protein [Oceanicaulis sp.]